MIWKIIFLSFFRVAGYYKNTPSEKMANFGLDINGKKHIDIRLGFEIKEGKYGKTYYPKTMFAINGKRIVSLSGLYLLSNEVIMKFTYINALLFHWKIQTVLRILYR